MFTSNCQIQFLDFCLAPGVYWLLIFLSEIDKFLVFTSAHALRAVPLDASPGLNYNTDAIVPYVGQNVNFVALGVDANEEYIYFSETRNDVIYRMHPDGTGKLLICVCRQQYVSVPIYNHVNLIESSLFILIQSVPCLLQVVRWL